MNGKLNSNAKVYYGDIYNLPDGLGKFDVVVFGMILTHLRDPFRALYSAGRLSTDSIIVTNQTMKTNQPVASFVPSLENHEAQAWGDLTNDEHWSAIEALATALAAKTSLQGDEVLAIIRGAA